MLNRSRGHLSLFLHLKKKKIEILSDDYPKMAQNYI
jgi:hypothetical protein